MHAVRIAPSLVACAALFAGGTAQAEVVATQPVPTPIVGADGVFAWSALDPRTGDVRLVATRG